MLNIYHSDVQKQQKMQREVFACSKWLCLDEDLTHKKVLNSSSVT
jgi:hypothetical protein